MSATGIRDPFATADLGGAHGLARLADERPSLSLERWVGRVLLVIALLAVLVCDLRIVHDTPNYLPDNEANRVAMLEHISSHGTPPVLGKDFFIVEPVGKAPADTTILRRMIAGQSPSVLVNLRYAQSLALERPYPYYVAAPIAWVVPWSHRILALRLFSILFACAALIFLWAAVREAWPANPVAAGVAALVLGTMSGLVEAFSTFQPQAPLFALWCAGLWLVLGDLRRRTCSPWAVAVCTAATCADGVALPAAIAAIAWLCVRSGGALRTTRAIAARGGIVLAPTIVWVIWNLDKYGDVWPLNMSAVAGTPDRQRHWRSLTAVLDTVYNVSEGLFDQLYSSGVAPMVHLDARPESLVALLVVLALSWALLSGRIAPARLALARLGVLMLGSFVSVYATLFLAAVFGAAPLTYSVVPFGGYAAAWAGVAGVGLSAPLVGHRRSMLVAVTLLTLVLVGVMLRAPTL